MKRLMGFQRHEVVSNPTLFFEWWLSIVHAKNQVRANSGLPDEEWGE